MNILAAVINILFGWFFTRVLKKNGLPKFAFALAVSVGISTLGHLFLPKGLIVNILSAVSIGITFIALWVLKRYGRF